MCGFHGIHHRPFEIAQIECEPQFVQGIINVFEYLLGTDSVVVDRRALTDYMLKLRIAGNKFVENFLATASIGKVMTFIDPHQPRFGLYNQLAPGRYRRCL